MSLLAKAMDFRLVEWRNSTTSEGGTSTSFVTHFDDFLGRGGRFGSLELSNSSTAKPKLESTKEEKGRRVLMIDDFPTTFTRSATALHAFRSSLLQYLSSGTGMNPLLQSAKAETNGSPPIVMIISEALLSSATASLDSLTAHRLLGPEICNHPCTHMIEYNPVAPTFIGKALEAVIKKEARNSKRRRIPGPAIMKRLSEMGDIRSAVNSLEFLCLRGDDTGDWGGTVASKTKKSNKDHVNLTAREQESLELVTQRESTLGMFHAVGKVVYNKRELPDPSSTDALTTPPDHLQHFHRPKISQVLIEELMNETGTDISTFVSSLHENYVLSCNGQSFVDTLNDCIEVLSDSDLLDTDSRRSIASYRTGVGSARPNVQIGSTDLIRQSEITFDVAVRGLLFYLPSPVSRATHPSGKKGDSHKMFFPAALRLWKKTEEIEGVASTWRRRLENGLPLDLISTSNETPQSSRIGVASWKSNNIIASAVSNGADRNNEPPQRLTTSRNDLMLQYLPYLNKILQPKDRSILGGLGLVTQFAGIDTPKDEEEDDDEELEMGLASEDVKVSVSVPIKAGTNGTQRDVLTKEHVGADDPPAMEKLYISYDDIEDD